MKKITLLFILLFMGILNAKARVYPELNKYDLNNWEEVSLDISGYDVLIQEILESDDGYYVIATYRESNERIPSINSNGEQVGVGTKQQEHTKVIKFDKNFNKIFEKSFFALLNTENPNPLAPTVETKLDKVAILKDGTIILSGYTFGLVRTETNTLEDKTTGSDDMFDTYYIRIDKDGNEIYKKAYYNQGLDSALGVAALENGGYVIKFSYVPTKTYNGTDYKKPTEFEADPNESYYYLVYDANNNMTSAIKGSEKDKLDYLKFINSDDLGKLKNTSDTYLGTDIAGNINTITNYKEQTGSNGILNIYEQKSKLKRGNSEIDLTNYKKEKYIDTVIGKNAIFFNDNSVLLADVLFDNNGNYVTRFEGMPNLGVYGSKLKAYYVMKDGSIIATSDQSDNKIYINRPIEETNSNMFNANIIVAGEKANFNVGAFVENERTFINLNNLCSLMHCTYTTSDSYSNLLIIRFDFMHNNKLIPEDFNTYSPMNNITYTITHFIGSKEYNSYLEFKHGEIFKLRSPTFNADLVDVTSKEIDGQVYVPLRFISEALGRYVEYSPSGENNLPTITISGQGEGEFYNKYDVGLSYSNLENNTILTNKLDYNDQIYKLNNIKLYAYGIDKLTNTIIDTRHTIIYPIRKLVSKEYKDIDYLAEEVDNIYYKNTEISSNTGDLVCINNYIYNPTFNGSALTDSNLELHAYTAVAISNIEGYPFIRLLNVI